jgi:hypothetical protein
MKKSHSSAPRLVPISVAAMLTSALMLEVNGATLHIEAAHLSQVRFLIVSPN